VENGDEVAIELKSPNAYDSVSSATLTISNQEATFYIITMSEDYAGECDLDISSKLRVFSIFELLKDTYGATPDIEDSFLYTLKSMLEDRIDLENENCGPYQYLLDITESYLLDAVDDSNMNEDEYIAANCKKYIIDYDASRQAYFSENFIIMHYFVSTEALKNYINEKNPGN
jgi:hypothetical protein